MDHLFEVGKAYENMKGCYTVLSISPPKMQIQYEDGSQSTADIAIQERIWERIQHELALAQQEYERRTRVNRPAITFSGLTEGDFKGNVTGTNWRSREGLAGLVSQQLSDMSGIGFTSCAIYRRPQFFVYPPHLPMFNQAEGVKLPKFVVQLSSEAMLYGFYIEKSDEVMDSHWRWPVLLNLLSDAKWQEKLGQTMADGQLSWMWRTEEKIGETGQYRLSPLTVISSFGQGSEFGSLADLADHLHGLPEKQWCNLFLAKTMDKPEAIELGDRVARPISRTFNALTPFYSQLWA
jgi:hypothetical protein